VVKIQVTDESKLILHKYRFMFYENNNKKELWLLSPRPKEGRGLGEGNKNVLPPYFLSLYLKRKRIMRME